MSDKTTETPKLGSAKSIGFRPGPVFRKELEDLTTTHRWSISDVARVGLQAFWPEIRALIIAGGSKVPKTEADILRLREQIELCRTAEARGVDPKQALIEAMEAKLSAEAASALAPA